MSAGPPTLRADHPGGDASPGRAVQGVPPARFLVALAAAVVLHTVGDSVSGLAAYAVLATASLLLLTCTGPGAGVGARLLPPEQPRLLTRQTTPGTWC